MKGGYTVGRTKDTINNHQSPGALVEKENIAFFFIWGGRIVLSFSCLCTPSTEFLSKSFIIPTLLALG